MDFDDFDDFDDIADEDLIAASQAPVAAASSRYQPAKLQTPAAKNKTGAAQANRVQRASVTKQALIDLEDLPSDAFLSSPANGQPMPQRGLASGGQQPPRIGGTVPAYRQTTLFGETIQQASGSTPSQTNRNHAFVADLPAESPTHHKLHSEALKTWVYPTNLGPTRDYQFSIVKNGLFNNTLVALPTGLGKTFIAATIMLNFFRWTKSAKIVFMAPTKPLVAQQVDACFHIAGIPRSETTVLTGEVTPALRAEEWESKRVFFTTPQTLQNDLSHGYADPKSICLLVVDEAHRATGNYSYVSVINFMRRFSSSFRVLALTATPGSKVEAVQEVIDNLGVSHVEIRTEESIDIRPYIHTRDEDIISLDPSDEMNLIKDLYSKALKPLVDKLSQQNIYYGRDPTAITPYGLLQAKKDWLARASHMNQGAKFMIIATFTVLQTLAHGIKLLNFHGIKPFYDDLVQFREETEKKGEKGPKTKRQILDSPHFQEMMDKIAFWLKKEDFVSHPKLTCLSDTILNHFMDAGEGRDNGPTNTRVIVFSEYRDSAEEIVRVLNRHSPLVRAAVFVGQADTKKSSGMKQAEQIERIQKFKQGEFNVLVATSIGEEGLDIGQVDLIICYDASKSPIRMLQRMGRTGRKRAGRAVLLLMKGKEEDAYAESKDGYQKMQLMICDGSRFNFRHDLSTRIIPREVRPEVDMRAVDIPVENTQVQGLPEPKKGRAKKKPPKKFHMPDGVETGFTSVASLLTKKPGPKKAKEPRRPAEEDEEDEVVEIPPLSQVILNPGQLHELNTTYKRLPYCGKDLMEDIEPVNLNAHPEAQRRLQKTVHLKHGEYTKRTVKLFRNLAKGQADPNFYDKQYSNSDASLYLKKLGPPSYGLDTDSDTAEPGPARKKRKVAPDLDDSEIEELPSPPPRLPKTKKPASAKPASTKPTSAKKSHHAQRNVVEDNTNDEGHLPLPRKRTATSKPKASAKKTSAPRQKGRSKKNQRVAAVYDESADEGDDCRRTSDLELTDDSDNGSDLEGFVVGDDVATSSNFAPTSSIPTRKRRSTSPTSPPTSSAVSSSPPKKKQQRQQQKKPPHHEPARFTATQDSDDDDTDIPSMSQFMRNRLAASRPSTSHVHNGDDIDDSDEDIPVRTGKDTRRQRTKSKAIFIDDDDDDGDEIIEESDRC
ncbi:P-loop containing nucleoside triphosphate hydrolase protein [Hypoxylon sp. FL1150]|nr:P-loop containing nucleoside triphosphate hydrolase protein [Hypoxylon sp. FL1150]